LGVAMAGTVAAFILVAAPTLRTSSSA
jgi:hypothetical protein